MSVKRKAVSNISKSKETKKSILKFKYISDLSEIIEDNCPVGSPIADVKWKTHTGDIIKIEHMDDNHIINTLRILERNAICMAMGKQIGRLRSNQIWINELHAGYNQILAEARKRKLDTSITKPHIIRLIKDVKIKIDLIIAGRQKESAKTSRLPAPVDYVRRDKKVPVVILNILATAYDNNIISLEAIKSTDIFNTASIENIKNSKIIKSNHKTIKSKEALIVTIFKEELK